MTFVVLWQFLYDKQVLINLKVNICYQHTRDESRNGVVVENVIGREKDAACKVYELIKTGTYRALEVQIHTRKIKQCIVRCVRQINKQNKNMYP